MKIRHVLLLVISHAAIGVLGFMGGVYTLPIWIAPTPPTLAELNTAAAEAQFSGSFKRNLKGSDAFHWGEGVVSISSRAVSFAGELAPGPDYKLYLSPKFVETEAEFQQHKKQMVRIGDVKTFKSFVVAMPANVNPADYSTVIVWCETFEQFITSAQYQ